MILSLNNHNKRLLFLLWIILCILIVSRRPDMVLNAQPWAEDGMLFISSAINDGFDSFTTLYAGYLHFIPRLITIISLYTSILFTEGILLLPLFMNLSSIFISGFCCLYICFDRFCWLAPISVRTIIAILIVLLPGTGEIYGNVSNIQWWLGLVVLISTWDMIVNRRLPSGVLLLSLVLISLSCPLGVFAVLGCVIVLIKKIWQKGINNINYRIIADFIPLVLLGLASLLQIVMVLINRTPQLTLDIFSFIKYFSGYLFGGVYARLIIINFASAINNLHLLTVILIGLIFVIILFYIFNKNKSFLIVPTILTFLLAFIISIEIPGFIEIFQEPFCDGGGRYYFLPMSITIIMTVSAIWSNWSGLSKLKLTILYILIVLAIITMIANFSIQSFDDKHWDYYVRNFDMHGENICEVPINPDGWTMLIPCK